MFSQEGLRVPNMSLALVVLPWVAQVPILGCTRARDIFGTLGPSSEKKLLAPSQGPRHTKNSTRTA